MTIADKIRRAKTDYDDVHNAGFDEGREWGFEEGRDFGYDEGYGGGYDKGRIDGYNEGYADGVSGSTVTFQKDESTAYVKTVPNNAEPKAMLLSVGGMTKKCNNLVHIPDIEANMTSPQGDTISVYLTDTIFVSAETLATVSSSIWRLKFDYADGTSNYIVDSAFESGGWGIKASADNPIVSITYRATYITEGKYSGFMVSYSTTRVPYEPYFEGLRDSKVTEIVNRGKNLANINAITNTTYLTVENDSISITTSVATGGGINCGKTLQQICPGLKVGDVCILTANTTSKSKYIYITDTYKDSWYFGTNKTITQEMLDGRVLFYADGMGTSAVISEFMIEFGTTATEYEPYHETIYTIPEEVQALEGYGKGIDSVDYNYIDFNAKKYEEVCEEIVITGNETIYAYAYNGMNGVIFNGALNTALNRAKGICTDSDKVGKHFSSNSIWLGVDNNTIYWIGILDILGLSTVDEFKAYLADRYENGNPVRIVLERAQPITTDLSTALADFDNILDVERGGSIEFVNEYKHAVPSSILYTKKVGT